MSLDDRRMKEPKNNNKQQQCRKCNIISIAHIPQTRTNDDTKRSRDKIKCTSAVIFEDTCYKS